jgi:hypothetical protein
VRGPGAYLPQPGVRRREVDWRLRPPKPPEFTLTGPPKAPPRSLWREAKYDDNKHPRFPKGTGKGGEFAPKGGGDTGGTVTLSSFLKWPDPHSKDNGLTPWTRDPMSLERVKPHYYMALADIEMVHSTPADMKSIPVREEDLELEDGGSMAALEWDTGAFGPEPISLEIGTRRPLTPGEHALAITHEIGHYLDVGGLPTNGEHPDKRFGWASLGNDPAMRKLTSAIPQLRQVPTGRSRDVRPRVFAVGG